MPISFVFAHPFGIQQSRSVLLKKNEGRHSRRSECQEEKEKKSKRRKEGRKKKDKKAKDERTILSF